MFEKKKGISLIVLIITIVVIIILASVIVMSFSDNNPIERANEAKFKSDLSGFRNELIATHSDKSTEDIDYVSEDVNVNMGDYATFKKYIPDITENYANKLLIRKGKLLYIYDETSEDYSEEEKKFAKDIGIESPFSNLGDADGDGYVTKDDYEYIQNYLAAGSNSSGLPKEQLKAMNADSIGGIDINDVEFIQKLLELQK